MRSTDGRRRQARGGQTRVHQLPLEPRQRPMGITAMHRYSAEATREYRCIDEMERRIEWLGVAKREWQEAAQQFRAELARVEAMEPMPRDEWRMWREDLIEALTAIAGADDLIEHTRTQLAAALRDTTDYSHLRLPVQGWHHH